MREPKVLLIYPPNQLIPKWETPRPGGDLGLLYLAGALEEIGVDVSLLDTSVGTEQDSMEETFFRGVMQENGLIRVGMPWKRIREVIAKGKFDIVGIHSNFTPQTRMALKVGELAKEANPEVLVVAGGINARNLWQRFQKTGNFDLVCTTDGERVIQEIVQRFRDRQSYENIAGTILFKDEVALETKVGPDTIIWNLDQLPFPAYHLLPFTKYEQTPNSPGVNITGEVLRYASNMTSRGCPFHCLFCHVSMERKVRLGVSKAIEETRIASVASAGELGKLRLKSVPRVMRELKELRRLGVTKVFFEDDSLLAKKTRVKEIFDLLPSLDLKLADVNGVNLVHLCEPDEAHPGKLIPDKEFMELLYNGGLNQITFPVESGSQQILKKYATNKLDHERMDVIELVRVACEVGILCPVNMMIGFPDETEEEIMASVELAKRLIDAGAIYVTFFIPIPFPGSALYNMALEKNYLSPDYDTDIFNWKRPVMRNTTVPPERLEEIRDRAWNEVNPPEHIAKRIQESVGAQRWSYEKPDNEG